MHKLNKIRRFLAIVAIGTTVVLAVTIALRMRQVRVPKVGIRKLPVQVDVSLQKVHYTETKEGKKHWDLSAERAEYNKASDTTSLTGVRLTVAGSASTGELEVSADRAEYHNGTRDINLAGNVLGKSSKGMEFSAPRVDYIAVRSRLQTNERVHLKDAGLELEGTGMEFETQTRRFKLLKDVSAVYRQQGAR